MTQNSDGLSIPIPISQGGTNATTAPNALTSLGALPIAGGTMTGNLILNADPTTALGAVTKQYADAIASGLTIKQAVFAATTANLTATYSNGASGVGATLTNSGTQAVFSIDGVSPAVNARVLIKDQTTTADNGIYSVTNVGSISTNWVLTRTTDFDQPSEITPGSFVIVNNGTDNAVTSWIETATVTTVGTDPVTFSEFTAGVGANTALSNLSSTAVNTDILPATDITQSLGDAAKRYLDVYAENYNTGITGGDTMLISGYNTGASDYTDFITITVGSTATCAFDGSVTSVTQTALDNSTKIATTAYVDAAVTAGGANLALSNLSGVAINDSLTPASDGVIDLGSAGKRWADAYIEEINTGITNGQTLLLSGFNSGSSTFTPFMTITANSTATAALAGAVTGVTQSPGDNTSKLATTAFVTAAITAGTGANTTLSNLGTVAANASLIPGTDGALDLGAVTTRWRDLFAQRLKTGTGNGNTLALQAYNTGSSSYYTFATLIAGSSPSMTLDSLVTATTQSPGDNSTKLATTAYVDASAATGANEHLSNLVSTAVNVSIIPGVDNSINLGSAALRYANLYVDDLRAGTTGGNVLAFSAYNTGSSTYTDFITATTGATATCSLASAVTATTQSPADNSTKIATTAYADAISALKANVTLGNLSGVAINTALLPATDNAIDLGSAATRFRAGYIETINTGTTNGQTTLHQAYNTGGSSYTTFITLTAGATPTCAFSGAITGVTQTALDNSTKLSTTAYVDAAVTAASASYANLTLSNLGTVAANASISPGTDNAIDLGTATKRWRAGYLETVNTGQTNGQTTLLQAYNTGGSSYTTFVTLTAGATPTCALASSVTAATQSSGDNSTKIATTAYVDANFPVTVAKGGTGLTSMTAYAVLCGGTTTTGAVQSIASVGTSGQVLTSNGPSALPTFQPAGSGISSIGPGYGSGRFYPATNLGHGINVAVSTFTGTPGDMYFLPFICLNSATALTINVYVTSSISSSNCNMGVYANASGQPTGSPLANSTSGSISTASTGLKSFTFGGGGIALTAGTTYWLALADSGSPTQATFAGIPSTSYANVSNALGFSSASAISGNPSLYGWLQAFVYNTTLPAVGSISGIAASAVSMPLIYLGF